VGYPRRLAAHVVILRASELFSNEKILYFVQDDGVEVRITGIGADREAGAARLQPASADFIQLVRPVYHRTALAPGGWLVCAPQFFHAAMNQRLRAASSAKGLVFVIALASLFTGLLYAR
jgi:hypothetical protein